jgi:hypothetical protein
MLYRMLQCIFYRIIRSLDGAHKMNALRQVYVSVRVFHIQNYPTDLNILALWALMCSRRWQLAPIISRNSINWFGFVIEKQCDFCEVRTEFLNIIYTNFMLYKTKVANVVGTIESPTAAKVRQTVKWFGTWNMCMYYDLTITRSVTGSTQPREYSWV